MTDILIRDISEQSAINLAKKLTDSENLEVVSIVNNNIYLRVKVKGNNK